MSFQLTLSFTDDQFDAMRDHYNAETTSDLRETLREEAETAVLPEEAMQD